jgi:hypothetical protein
VVSIGVIWSSLMALAQPSTVTFTLVMVWALGA